MATITFNAAGDNGLVPLDIGQPGSARNGFDPPRAASAVQVTLGSRVVARQGSMWSVWGVVATNTEGETMIKLVVERVVRPAVGIPWAICPACGRWTTYRDETQDFVCPKGCQAKEVGR